MAALATPASPRNIWVRIDHNAQVIAQDVVVSKTRKEQVEWFGAVDQPYTVRFPNESPFHDREFHIPIAGSVCSGPVHEKTKIDEKYKYEIWQNGVMVVDPQIIIRN